jgi:UDP:flavonoid glycosyltransferase YjiC (YdhE family)
VPASVVFDILLIGDFRFPGGTSTAIATEIQAQSRAGYRTGLLALKGPILKHPHPFHPAIRRLIDQGAATLVDPRQPIRAPLTLAHHPQVFTHLPTRALDLDTELALLVVHHPAFDGAEAAVYDPLTCTAHCEAFLGRPVVWAPVGPAVRPGLERFRGRIEILEFDWHNCLEPADWSGPRQGPAGPRPIIGRHSRPDPLKWPPDRAAVLRVYPDDPAIDVRVLGGGAFLDSLMGSYPANWRVEPFDPEAPRRFLDGIDFFVFYHHPRWIEAFGRTILEALASGCVVVLPPHFEPLFGPAALYAEPAAARALILATHADPAAFAAQSAAGHAALVARFSTAAHVARLGRRLGHYPAIPTTLARASAPATGRHAAGRRVLMMSSNGVGLGHLTRLLAIARRLPAGIEPVFVTLSQALALVEAEGYLAEYLPFHVYLEVPPDEWNRHLAADLAEIVAFYRPAVLVFDGNVPYQGLLDTLRRFPETIAVWSRRGFWRTTNDTRLLARETAFDMVLEPGDLAASMDQGPTTRHRDRTRPLAPVRLVEAYEALDRAAALAALDLDPAHRHVLLQLGSGNNFETDHIARFIAERLRDRPDVRLVHIVSPITLAPLDLPDWVLARRVYPLGRYLAAFDACVSAVGYNSYHELMLGGCPTLFVPNEHPSMDDQLARAAYAERHGWALVGRVDRIFELEEKLMRLLDPEIAARQKRRLATLDQANGAHEAARLIGEYARMCRADRAR